MLSDLQEVGITRFDEQYIDPNNIFNVKFKTDSTNFIRFDPPALISDPQLEIGKNKHYVLLPRMSNSIIGQLRSESYKFKEGHTITQTGAVDVQMSRTNYKKSLRHKKI